MSDVKWIHLNVDMFDNRKIRYLRKLPAGNDIILIWVMLLTLAGKCNAGGMILLTQNVPYTISMLADEFDFDENTVKLAIEAFVELGMVSNDGFLSITGWEEHQDSDGLDRLREYNRIAKQKSRERQKQKQLQVLNSVNDQSLTCHGTNIDPSYSLYNSKSGINESKESNGGVGEEREEKDETASLNEDAKTVVQEWNKTRLPKVMKVRPESGRGKSLRARIREYGIDEVLKAVKAAESSDFLQEKPWFDFGWFVRPENFVKVLEGKYNRNGVGSNKQVGHGSGRGKDQDLKSKYSDLSYIDPDDESTWGT